MKEWKVKLNEYKTKLKDWWARLALREKQAVIAGGSLLAIFIVYQGLWAPLLAQVADVRDRIQHDQQTLVWMQAAESVINKIELTTRNKNKPVPPVILLSILQKHIDSDGLASNLVQLKQASNETIEMHFQKMAFDKLMRLLINVSREQHVAITQLSVMAETTPGIVNADVTLKI